ncbi:MAG: hypothetical protein R2709_09300 [Marmoricola sp.]
MEQAFAPGAELKKYAEHVADKYDLRRHMRFGEAVKRAVWQESDQCWEVTTQSGQTVRGAFILTATGFLSQPGSSQTSPASTLLLAGDPHGRLGSRL